MKRIPLLGLGLVLLITLTGCDALSAFEDSPTFLNPASPSAGTESRLHSLIFVLAALVFLIVEGLLVYNVLRFRRKPHDDKRVPRQIDRATLLEVIYTGIPILLVLFLFIVTIRTMNAVAAPERRDSDLNVRVVGYRWWWEFEYPDLGIVTANELHVPVHTNVHIRLESVDVIHSLWVPQLSGKMDAIPGQPNEMWFRATKVGDYTGLCSEYCGLNHATMRLRVVVDRPEDFNRWVAGQQATPYQPQTDLEQRGYQMITQGLCVGCHSFDPQQTPHVIGPDLAHLFSRSTFAGASFDLTEDNLRRWLQDPQAMKPGNLMTVKLNDQDVQALMAYFTAARDAEQGPLAAPAQATATPEAGGGGQ